MHFVFFSILHVCSIVMGVVGGPDVKVNRMKLEVNMLVLYGQLCVL